MDFHRDRVTIRDVLHRLKDGGEADMTDKKQKFLPTPATRRLQRAVASCSLIFALGTALHNFVIIDPSFIETMMKMAGVSNPAAEAVSFTKGFRIVGCLYIVGNALGVLSIKSRSGALWWILLFVNMTQGLGFALIPASMWRLALDVYGVWGILPSAITDGGALVLVMTMIYSMIKYRSTWGQRRAPS